MLIICTNEEKDRILHQCKGMCGDCVFKDMNCPIDKRDIATTEEIATGHVVGFPV